MKHDKEKSCPVSPSELFHLQTAKTVTSATRLEPHFVVKSDQSAPAAVKLKSGWLSKSACSVKAFDIICNFFIVTFC